MVTFRRDLAFSDAREKSGDLILGQARDERHRLENITPKEVRR